MKSSVDIVNALAKKLGGVTDYRVAKETGIPQSTLSSVRAGRCSLSRENCAKAAEVLGVEVGALIAIVTAEREENPAIKQSLLRVARKGMAAAAIAAAVGLSVAPAPPAHAASATQQAGPLFIMSTRRRRQRRATFGADHQPERRRAVGDRRIEPQENLPVLPRDKRKSSRNVTSADFMTHSTLPTLTPA